MTKKYLITIGTCSISIRQHIDGMAGNEKIVYVRDTAIRRFRNKNKLRYLYTNIAGYAVYELVKEVKNHACIVHSH